MIVRLGSVELPINPATKIERVTDMVTRRTVNGRMISKKKFEKYRLNLSLEGVSITLPLQTLIYQQAMLAWKHPIEVAFIDPATSTEKTVLCKCTGLPAPAVGSLSNRRPYDYSGIAAIFEEV